MRLRCLSVVSSLLACLAAYSLPAQDSPQPSVPSAQNPAPLIRTGAQAVAVDVVVTHGSDEPVLGLHQQDFKVLEDGELQSIDLFEEHSAADTPAAPQPLPPHVYTNLPAAPRSDAVNVLLLDSLNTAQADQANVRKQIESFLGNLPPGARIALYTLNTRLSLLQGFTNDKGLLQAALLSKAAAPGSAPASRTREDNLRDKEELSMIAEMGAPDALQAHARALDEQASTESGQRTSLTLAALQQLARSLIAIPGRKNLLWFASSFPVSIFPNGSSRQTLPNGREIADGVRLTASLLTQSRVALYPVSAQGILIDSTMNADSGGQPEGDNFERSPLQQSAANSANTAAMEQLASDTGGQALYSSNNLSQAMARAIRNGSHYYTLVYTPSSTKMDGRFHRIEVKLTQGKAKLSYRRGYYADDARAAKTESAADLAAKPASDPLAPLLAHGLPSSTQVVYQARVLPASPQPAPGAPRAGGNTKLPSPITRWKVDFVLDAGSVALDPAPDGAHAGKIELALIAYVSNGEVANWTGNTLAISLNAASYAEVQRSGIPVHLEIDLPSSGAWLATGVYDLTARRAGTLEIQLAPQSTAAADLGTTSQPPKP